MNCGISIHVFKASCQNYSPNFGIRFNCIGILAKHLLALTLVNLLNCKLQFHSQQNGENNLSSIIRVGHNAYKAHSTLSDMEQIFQTWQLPFNVVQVLFSIEAIPRSLLPVFYQNFSSWRHTNTHKRARVCMHTHTHTHTQILH